MKPLKYKKLINEIDKTHAAGLFNTPANWFNWLEAQGWSPSELRDAVNSARKKNGKPLETTCGLCKRYHDTLAIAMDCKNESGN